VCPRQIFAQVANRSPQRARAASSHFSDFCFSSMDLLQKFSTLAAVALLIGCTDARAEMLDQLIAEAQANNPELNYYQAEIKAAKGERRTADEWANPEVTTDAGARL